MVTAGADVGFLSASHVADGKFGTPRAFLGARHGGEPIHIQGDMPS